MGDKADPLALSTPAKPVLFAGLREDFLPYWVLRLLAVKELGEKSWGKKCSRGLGLELL